MQRHWRPDTIIRPNHSTWHCLDIQNHPNVDDDSDARGLYEEWTAITQYYGRFAPGTVPSSTRPSPRGAIVSARSRYKLPLQGQPVSIGDSNAASYQRYRKISVVEKSAMRGGSRFVSRLNFSAKPYSFGSLVARVRKHIRNVRAAIVLERVPAGMLFEFKRANRRARVPHSKFSSRT